MQYFVKTKTSAKIHSKQTNILNIHLPCTYMTYTTHQPLILSHSLTQR